MKIRRFLLGSFIALAFTSAFAYDDYDDDIYYNARAAKEKAEKKAKEEAEKAAKARSEAAYVPNIVVDYEDPSLVAVGNDGLDVDVDVYNRRGQFLVADTIAPSESVGGTSDTYAYTRRIERFYNDDIVNGSGDQTLIDTYYSTSEPEINVYVVNTSPWRSYGWYNPWNPWSWNSLYWNSWYYGPSLSWGIYDPWYSWGWGPSWGWNGPGWGPPPGGHHPGWGPSVPGGGPNRPGGNWAVNNPGSSRPHTPVTGTSSARRPGAFSAGANTSFTRPGNMGQSSRPGTHTTVSTPAQTTRPSTPSVGNTGGTRGRGNNNSTVSTPSRTSTNNSGTIRNTGGSSRSHSSVGGGTRSSGGSTGGGTRGRR